MPVLIHRQALFEWYITRSVSESGFIIIVGEGYEAPKTMAAPVRTNQGNQAIRHPRTTFGVVAVNVNKRSVSADARAFTPNYLLGADLFNSKRTFEG